MATSEQLQRLRNIRTQSNQQNDSAEDSDVGQSNDRIQAAEMVLSQFEQARANVLSQQSTKAKESITNKNVQQGEGTSGVPGFGVGAAKGLGKTLFNIGNIGQSVLDNTVGRVVNATAGNGFTKLQNEGDQGASEGITNNLKPEGLAEKAGFLTEQVGEYFVPGMASGKVLKATDAAVKANKLSKGVGLAKKALIDGSGAAGVTAVQGGDAKDITVSGVVGGVISPVFSLVQKALKPSKAVDEVVGQIAQGETKNIPAFKRALELVNTKGVRSFKDLSGKFDEIIPTLSREVDTVLAKDATEYALPQLALKVKNKAGQPVSTDYISRALTHLKELYSATGDDVLKSDIDGIIVKASEKGLTKKEVNDIARVYGQEFSQKAFSKTGDPLTSVNAQAYENTRKGLKTVARKGLEGKEAKVIDEQLSSIYEAKNLVEKNVEAVNKLQQKIQKRGLLEKLGNTSAKTVDMLTGGTIRGFVAGLLPRGAGYKTMNALDVEQALQKNLQLVEKALKTKSDNALVKILEELSSGLGRASVVKGSVELSQMATQP